MNLKEMKKVPRMVNVRAKPDMFLEVEFKDGTIKEIDIKPYLNKFEPFKELQNNELFNSVHIDGGYGIVWNDNIDISIYDVWEYGQTIN